MAIDLVKVPSVDLRNANEGAGLAYRAMRDAVMTSGPLDAPTCELILLACFAMGGYERSFKIHALRALRAGFDAAAIRQAVLVPLGPAATLGTLAAALGWLEEAEQAANGDLADKDVRRGT